MVGKGTVVSMKARTYESLVFLVGSAFLPLGCFSGEAVVGDEAEGTGGSHVGAPLPEKQEGELACAEEDQVFWDAMEALREPNSLSGIAGTWTGALGVGLKANLALREDGTGTMFFGDAPKSFEPATQGDVGYACDHALGAYGACLPSVADPWIEGFEYTVRLGSFTGESLSFYLEPTEPWSAWCQLQEPHAWGECDYHAWPYAGALVTANGPCLLGDQEVDCGWLALVSKDSVCQCTSAQCFAGGMPYGASLVVSNDQTSLSGSLALTDLQLERR